MDTFTAQTIGGTPLPQAVPLVTFTAQTIQGDTQGWTRSPAHDPNAATTAAAAASQSFQLVLPQATALQSLQGSLTASEALMAVSIEVV